MTTSIEPQELDLLTIRCAAGTDVGMRREENQDAFGIIKHQAFHAFFVADGMGGVAGGAIASRLAIATLQETLPRLGAQISQESLSHLLGSVNRKIFEQGANEAELAGMGTTVVGLVFTRSGLLIVNVGDSRAYRIRKGKIHQMTEDHTLVQELIDNGAITPDEADDHPVSHMLTRSLGPLSEVVVDCHVESEAPQRGDIYVLCSDGLYNFVQSGEILKTVEQNPLDDANQILINLANRRGGADNITVLVISIGDTDDRRREPRASQHSVRGGGKDSQAREKNLSLSEVSQVSKEGAPETTSQRRPGDTDESPPVVPPQVEEPKDPSEGRAVRKRGSGGFEHHRSGIPVATMLFTAVLVGLVLGDVARRWGVLPEMTEIFTSPEHEDPDTLDDLSRQLSIPTSRREARGKLPEIARLLQQGGNEDLIAKYGAAREERVASKRKTLEDAALKLERNLEILAKSDTSNAGLIVKRIAKSVESQSREISDIEAQIDATSRKLSLWFGRRKNLEPWNGGLLKAGGDLDKIGATSAAVKKKVVELDEVEYRVQAKLDESELYPGNEALRKEVSDLQAIKDRVMGELRVETTKAVDGILADTYAKLEKLKFRRDEVATKLREDREESRLMRVVADPDPIQRDILRQRIQGELDDIRAALKDLGTGD
jgi:serine/threonine protein phosphatase PrpC